MVIASLEAEVAKGHEDERGEQPVPRLARLSQRLREVPLGLRRLLCARGGGPEVARGVRDGPVLARIAKPLQGLGVEPTTLVQVPEHQSHDAKIEQRPRLYLGVSS